MPACFALLYAQLNKYSRTIELFVHVLYHCLLRAVYEHYMAYSTTRSSINILWILL